MPPHVSGLELEAVSDIFLDNRLHKKREMTEVHCGEGELRTPCISGAKEMERQQGEKRTFRRGSRNRQNKVKEKKSCR
jgi:hypothetical protein